MRRLLVVLWWLHDGRAAAPAVRRAARVPRRRLLASVVGAAVPLPARSMWQLWTSDDMEFYVNRDATPGDAASVLRAMDACAETSWMMNMGPAKGAIVEALVAERRPRRLLEVGTFLSSLSPASNPEKIVAGRGIGPKSDAETQGT